MRTLHGRRRGDSPSNKSCHAAHSAGARRAEEPVHCCPRAVAASSASTAARMGQRRGPDPEYAAPARSYLLTLDPLA